MARITGLTTAREILELKGSASWNFDSSLGRARRPYWSLSRPSVNPPLP